MDYKTERLFAWSKVFRDSLIDMYANDAVNDIQYKAQMVKYSIEFSYQRAVKKLRRHV